MSRVGGVGQSRLGLILTVMMRFFLTIDLRFCICRKFDGWLKAKDPSFGVRNLEDVIAEAAKHRMELEDTLEMPANNLSVILRKTKD